MNALWQVVCTLPGAPGAVSWGEPVDEAAAKKRVDTINQHTPGAAATAVRTTPIRKLKGGKNG